MFGLLLAFFVALMLSPKPEDKIPMYRPTYYMRAFLSASFLLPIAVISYSLYLFHLIVQFLLLEKWIKWYPDLLVLATDPSKCTGALETEYL